MASQGKVSVVIPVYRSEESLEALVARLLAVFEKMGRDCEIVLVDDCSPDNSWNVLKDLKQRHDKALTIVRLATNSGQHNAILCGFSLVTGDVVVTMDDDLQNPPEELPKLVEAVDGGYDLAIGAYDSKKHSTARNASGEMIDWIQRRMFHLPADFQLTSFRAVRRGVVDQVCRMGGVFPYVTCMLLSNTSRYTNVSVRHDARPFGRSNYTLKRSLSLALNLLISYSALPLYFVGALSGVAFLFSLAYGMVILVRTLLFGTAVPGWASTVVILTFFNAQVLLSLLIVFTYISRIHQQITRTRVSYAIGELRK